MSTVIEVLCNMASRIRSRYEDLLCFSKLAGYVDVDEANNHTTGHGQFDMNCFRSFAFCAPEYPVDTS